MDQFPNGGRTYEYCLHNTQTGLRTAVERCLQALKPIADQFDTIYVTGHSGEIPGAVVAWLMHKELRILRKTDKEGNTFSHGTLVEGPNSEDDRYVIIDDFVERGTTLERLMKNANGHLVCVCLYALGRGTFEQARDYAAEFVMTDGLNIRTWRLTRRGPNSILFDYGMYHTCDGCPTWWGPEVKKPDAVFDEPIFMSPDGGKTRQANVSKSAAFSAVYGAIWEQPSQPSEPLLFSPSPDGSGATQLTPVHARKDTQTSTVLVAGAVEYVKPS